jgi:integrase
MAEDLSQRSLADAQPNGQRIESPPFADGTFTLLGLLPSWERSLKAKRKSDRTIADYLTDATRFCEWLTAQGMPVDPTAITREHVETFIVSELERVSERTGEKLKPGYVASAYRRLQQLFAWLDDEGEIPSNPMAKMSPPALEDVPVPVLPVDDLRALVAACEGSAFEARRDMAIVRTFIDTGCRLGELAGIQVDDVAWRSDLIRVYGKGRGGSKPRDVPYGPSTGQALDRYMRARARHRCARSEWLWLGTRGKSVQHMTGSGIARMLDRRADQAGIGHIHPHQFRHTQAHRWKKADGQDDALMQLMGWKSRDMLARYGASAAAERAREAHRKMGLGEDL